MAPAIEHRFEQRSFADVQCADALRGVNLVAGNRQEVAGDLVYVHWNLAGGLNGVGVEVDVGFGGDFSDCFDGLYYAGFVVGRHDGD